MKVCSQCKEELTLDNFNRRARASDGLRSECRKCQKVSSKNYYNYFGGMERKQDYYVRNRESLLPKLRLRGGKPKYNPEKAPARRAVNNAISRGELVRPTICEDCKRNVKTEAHHHLGYEKEHWLHVLWLCRTCHNIRDHPIFGEKLMKLQKESV